MDRITFTPLDQMISKAGWPFPEIIPDFMDEIYVAPMGYGSFETVSNTASQPGQPQEEPTKIARTHLYKILVGKPLTLTFGDFEGLQLVIGGSTSGMLELMLEVSIDPIRFSLKSPVTLLVTSDLLKPLKPGTFEADPQQKHLEIRLAEMSITVDQEGHFSFDLTEALTVPRCMISDSGVVLELSKLRYISPGSENLPAPISQAAPPDFTGICIDEASLEIEGFPLLDLKVSKLFLGNTGLSGTIGASWQAQLAAGGKAFTGPASGQLFDMPFAMKSLDLSFAQNSFTRAEASGFLVLPFFDQPVLLTLGFSMSGDVKVALSAQQVKPNGDLMTTAPGGGVLFDLMGIAELSVRGLAFVKQNDLYQIALTGSIQPTLDGKDWPLFDFQSVRIDSKGNVTIDGGWLELPKQKSMDFYGFQATLSKVGFGKAPDGTCWVGLSGGIRLVESVAVGGSVEGLKIKWHPDRPDSVDLELAGVAVDFEITDVLKFAGSVAFFNEKDYQEFRGSMELMVYPVKFGIGVDFMAGTEFAPNHYNYFFVSAKLTLPVGMPLLQTGLGIFGAALLFGYNVYPTKGDTTHPNENWYDWYKSDPKGITKVGGVGGGRSKWKRQQDSLALGAGLTLGTQADNGYTFAAETLFAILLPGPVIMVQGIANLLEDRAKLTVDPMFGMLAVYDHRAGTFMMNLEGKYKLPKDTGKTLVIQGMTEAFFDFKHPERWHFYIGQKEAEKRVRADIISIFQAYFYFMVDNSQLATGGRIEVHKKWDYDPLTVEVGAYIGGELLVRFKPVYAYGLLEMGGVARLSACGIKASLQIAAKAEMEAPPPLRVYAAVEASIDLPWPLPDKSVKCEIEWKETVPPPMPKPLSTVGIEHLKTSEAWELKVYPQYDRDTDGFIDSPALPPLPENPSMWLGSPIVPLDAKPVACFSKPMGDPTLIGVNAQASPGAETIADTSFTYTLTGAKLYRQLADGSWSAVEEPGLRGKWQAMQLEGKPVNTKLMFWAPTSYEFSRNSIDKASWTEWAPHWETKVEVSPLQMMECYFDRYSAGTLLPATFRQGIASFLADAPVQVAETLSLSPVPLPEDLKGWVPAYQEYLETVENSGFHPDPVKTLWVDSKARYIPPEEHAVDFTAQLGNVYIVPMRIDDLRFRAQENEQAGDIVRIEAIPGYADPTGKTGALTVKPGTEVSFPKSIGARVTLMLRDQVTLRAYGRKAVLFEETLTPKQKGQWETREVTLTPPSFQSIDRIGFTIRETFTVALLKVSHTLAERLPATASKLSVRFDEPVRFVDVLYAEGSQGDAQMHYTSGGVSGWHVLEPAFLSPVPGICRFHGPIDQVDFQGNLRLAGLSYLEEARYQKFTEDQKKETVQQRLLSESWAAHEADLLVPDSVYKLELSTEVMRGGIPSRFIENAYFRTGSAPGLPSPWATGSEPGYPGSGPLATLAPYVASTVPANGSKGAYRFYDVGVLYNEPGTVEMMYQMAEAPLWIALKDNNGRPVLDADGLPVLIHNQWGDDSKVSLTRTETQYIEGYKNGAVAWATVRNHAVNKLLGVSNLSLLPSTPYTVCVLAVNRTAPEAPIDPTAVLQSQEVYRFQFITSPYGSFVHQVQSFRGEVFPGRNPVSADALLAADTCLALFKQSAVPESAVWFRLQELFQLPIGALPKETEALRLQDPRGTFGLLLSSAQPLEWQRIEMQSRWSGIAPFEGGAIVPEECTGPVKLLARHPMEASAAPDLSTEWFEVLLTQDTDLSGWTLASKGCQRNGPLIVPELEYAEVCSLALPRRYPSGTVVRYITGNAPEMLPDAPTPEVVLHALKKNQSLLREAHPIIAARDASGTVSAVRTFLEEDRFSPVEITRISSPDQTQAILLLTQNGQLTDERFEEGLLRLDLKFHRNLGADQVILKRNGCDAPETTTLELRL